MPLIFSIGLLDALYCMGMTSPKPPADRDLSGEIKLLKNPKQDPSHYNNETGLGGRFLLLYPLLIGLILLALFILKK